MFLPLNPSSGVPIYRQIADQIRRMLASGELRRDDRLPSVREAATRLGVSPLTAVKAYDELEREGLIEMRRGIGMFVTEQATLRRGSAARKDSVREIAMRFAVEAAQAGLSAKQASSLVLECFERLGSHDAREASK